MVEAGRPKSRIVENAYVRRLDAWRQELGMNHKQFSAHLGIDQSYWCHIRHGKRRGGMGAARIIARVRQERPELLYLLLNEPA